MITIPADAPKLPLNYPEALPVPCYDNGVISFSPFPPNFVVTDVQAAFMCYALQPWVDNYGSQKYDVFSWDSEDNGNGYYIWEYIRWICAYKNNPVCYDGSDYVYLFHHTSDAILGKGGQVKVKAVDEWIPVKGIVINGSMHPPSIGPMATNADGSAKDPFYKSPTGQPIWEYEWMVDMTLRGFGDPLVYHNSWLDRNMGAIVSAFMKIVAALIPVVGAFVVAGITALEKDGVKQDAQSDAAAAVVATQLVKEAQVIDKVNKDPLNNFVATLKDYVWWLIGAAVLILIWVFRPKKS